MELKSSELLSIKYHNIFDYPLTKPDLKKWAFGKIVKTSKIKTTNKSEYFFLKGRSEIIQKRIRRERYSAFKLKIAKKVASLLSRVDSIKFVGITGALSMNNADKKSDIDLMIITRKGWLWTTRLISYFLIRMSGFKVRSPRNKDEKDMLCLNIWLDETDIVWDKNDRNIYTSHEILQIVPLVNKDKTYEKFITKNKWALSFWPNVLKDKNLKHDSSAIVSKKFFLENTLYKAQYWYMKSKMTRETATPTRAVFHPNEWNKVILSKLYS